MSTIIGITGTDGAGKGTVVDYLVSKYGFEHYSARELLIDEIKKRGLPVDRNHMRLVANSLRKQHGNDYLARVAVSRFESEKVQKAVFESVRALDEARFLKNASAYLLAVDADQALRYERVQARRSESDRVSFEQFVAHEKMEMDDPDPHGMQKAEVIKMADHLVTNNGTVEELWVQVDDMLKGMNL